MALAEGTGTQAGKYTVPVLRSPGAQVGDHNTQVNYFVREYIDLRGAAGPAGSGAAGRLLAEVTDPFALEVHRPVQVDDQQPGLPELPAYVPRDHDLRLAEVVRAAAEGASGIAVLVGGSSTGKTRACWEALRLLREQPEGWRLWHPIDPSRPEAALRELPAIGSRTVIWLNEAQFYLDVAFGGLGEQVAAGLRELLRDPARAPVLVLGTLWPQFWARLTAQPTEGAADAHAQARELLAGRDVTVPAAFSAAQLPLLAAAGDPRLALAAGAAEDGRVIQFLAGAPELLARYRNALPPATALIDAAIDARRLGMGIALPLAFLEAAAPGYLTDTDWDALPEDWLEQALAYTAAVGKGTRGPLARIRPRDPASTRGAAYRLADYLEQHGRHVRRQNIPPASFWAAAARFASPGDLAALATAAEDRGLLRDAARLRKQAIGLGDISQAADFIMGLHSLNPRAPDPRPARWATEHVCLDNPSGIARLLDALAKTGAPEQVAALLARDPAAHTSLSDPSGIARLLDALAAAGAPEQVAALLARDPAAHTSLSDPSGIARLLDALAAAGAPEQVAALLARDPAAHTSLSDPLGVTGLLDALRGAGAGEQATALARRAAVHAPLDNLFGVARLLDALRQAGAGEQATALARRAAVHAPLDKPFGLIHLLNVLHRADAAELATALLARDPAAHASLDNPLGVVELLDVLQRVGAAEQATALLARDPAAHASLDKPFGVAVLLKNLGKAGAAEQVAALLARDPAARASLSDPLGVAWLLDALRGAGAAQQAAALARRAATHASLSDPRGVIWLLKALQRAGAAQQAAVLARRVATHACLEEPGDAAWLVDTVQEVGTTEQVRVLVERLPAEGRFAVFRDQAGHYLRYRYGRDLDGSPAQPWGWGDLG